MDGLSLLVEARAAGLIVLADGGRLVIRGPKSADAVARRLLAHKAVVLAALAAGNGNTTPANPEKIVSCVDAGPWEEATEPGPGCTVCGSLEQWQDALGRQRCGVCERVALNKGLQLAQRAARLRKLTQPRKPAHQDNAGCVPGGVVDMLDPKGKRPQ
jgi:hypothetical protein